VCRAKCWKGEYWRTTMFDMVANGHDLLPGGSVTRQGDAAGRDPSKVLKPARQRQMVDHARSTWRVSIRRACRALPVERSTYHYRSGRAGQAQLTERSKEIAATRVRYGYRRIYVLRRDGRRVNAKRVYRLSREMGLQLRHKTPKRRVKAKLREDRRPATRSNETWAMDFVQINWRPGRSCRSDDCRHVHPLLAGDRTTVQILRRRCRGGAGKSGARAGIAGSHPYRPGLGVRVARFGSVGLPARRHARPGKPTDDAFIESFNGKFRTECLNAHWFMSLDDARRKCEAWRRDYNEERPHSAIGNKAPIELINRSAALGPP
jgi:putative transposase